MPALAEPTTGAVGDQLTTAACSIPPGTVGTGHCPFDANCLGDVHSCLHFLPRKLTISMAIYSEPSFQERVALAQKAKQKALEKLRAKPPLDEAAVAARLAAKAAKEEAQAARRAEKLAAIEQAKADKIEKARLNAEAQVAAEQALVQSEADKKAARDARYAARKNRN